MHVQTDSLNIIQGDEKIKTFWKIKNNLFVDRNPKYWNGQRTPGCSENKCLSDEIRRGTHTIWTEMLQRGITTPESRIKVYLYYVCFKVKGTISSINYFSTSFFLILKRFRVWLLPRKLWVVHRCTYCAFVTPAWDIRHVDLFPYRSRTYLILLMQCITKFQDVLIGIKKIITIKQISW